MNDEVDHLYNLIYMIIDRYGDNGEIRLPSNYILDKQGFEWALEHFIDPRNNDHVIRIRERTGKHDSK